MTGVLTCAEHLEWIAASLERADLTAVQRATAAVRVARAQERMADPELHVAVLGETSSGKSTLLNAFLKQRLRPSSARVTTRTTLTIRYGPTAQVTDGATVSAASGGHGALKGTLDRLLTGDAADEVRDLTLSWPSPLLGEGVTITDTPGFSVDDAGHRDRAVAAAERADLVLVVVPAVAAMSSALADFLAGPLRDHHDRCAFVLTKVDLVDEAERADVLDATVRRLRELGIADPVVFPCVPESVLRTVADPDAGQAFSRVEADLVTLTNERRQSAIAATLSGLLAELLQAVEQAALRRGERLAEAEREIARLAVPDLRAFLENWSQEAISAGRRAIDVALEAASRSRFAADLETRLRTAVNQDSVTTGAEMAKVAVETMRTRLRAEADRILSTAGADANAVLRTSATSLADEFADQFRRLARLAGDERVPEIPAATGATRVAVPGLDGADDTLTAVGTRLSSSSALRTGGAAAIGAAAGSVLFPFPLLGTALGALVGGLLGAPGVTAMRTRFVAEASPVLADARSAVAALVRAAVDRIFVDYTGRVDRVCRRYLQDWSGEIEDLAAREAAARAELAEEIARAAATAKDARERREQINRLRAAMGRQPARIGAGETAS